MSLAPVLYNMTGPFNPTLNAEAIACPFCGCSEISIERGGRNEDNDDGTVGEDTDDGFDEFFASCTSCLADGPVSDSPREALDRWNGRTKTA